jgi:integrase
MAERKRLGLGLSEVRALQEGQTVWDLGVPGFGARRQKSDAVTYVLLYRTKEGRQRWYTIGRHGAPWTPDTARAKARKLLAEIADGGDPVATKVAARTALTVSDLCDQYLEDATAGRLLLPRGAAKKASTLYTDRRRIERHIKPLLGRHSVPSITRDDIEAFLHQVAEGATAGLHKTERGSSKTRGGKGTASRTVGLLGGIFTYAVRRKLRKDNPTQGVVRFADGKRERRLSDAEYAQFGAGLISAAVAPAPIRPGVRPGGSVWPDAIAAARFLLLTGWRRGEALGLTRDEVDLPRRTATLADSKTGVSMRPLSQAACEVLKAQGPGGGDTLVFKPSRGEGLMGGFPWLFQRIVKAAGLPADVTPHVLRHSFASLASDLGYSEATIAALIGHQGRSVTSRYVHAADAVLLAAADRICGNILHRCIPKGLLNAQANLPELDVSGVR